MESMLDISGPEILCGHKTLKGSHVILVYVMYLYNDLFSFLVLTHLFLYHIHVY